MYTQKKVRRGSVNLDRTKSYVLHQGPILYLCSSNFHTQTPSLRSLADLAGLLLFVDCYRLNAAEAYLS